MSVHWRRRLNVLSIGVDGKSSLELSIWLSYLRRARQQDRVLGA